MVYMIYNRAPFALLAKAESPIKTFKDLPGKKLGAPPGGADAVITAGPPVGIAVRRC